MDPGGLSLPGARPFKTRPADADVSAMRRTTSVALVLTLLLSGCGGDSSDDPPPPTSTTVADRPGGSIGVADAIDRTRAVADRAEQRATSIDEMAP